MPEITYYLAKKEFMGSEKTANFVAGQNQAKRGIIHRPLIANSFLEVSTYTINLR
jgi:hypothetical protein